MYITKMFSINRAHYTIVHTGHSFGDNLPLSVSLTACHQAVSCVMQKLRFGELFINRH